MTPTSGAQLDVVPPPPPPAAAAPAAAEDAPPGSGTRCPDAAAATSGLGGRGSELGPPGAPIRSRRGGRGEGFPSAAPDRDVVVVQGMEPSTAGGGKREGVATFLPPSAS